MPKIIFNKNSEVTEGRLFRIAKDQAHIDDNAGWPHDLYEIVDVSQTDFNQVKLGAKSITNFDGTNITYVINTYQISSEEHIAYKNMVLDQLNDWLESNSSKPFATNVTNYKNYLNSLDISTIPSTTNLEQHINSQGEEVINILELL